MSEAVRKKQTRAKSSQLFTTGYEGRDVDTYVSELVENKVKLLCDVKKNPISRRKGFSKNKLKGAVEAAGIEYRHFPELGVPREQRQAAKTPAARKRMFARYEREILPREHEALEQLASLLEEYGKIALTCVERDHTDCHRSLVAKGLEKITEAKRPVKNL
jgi:uncharacterized protein (DUF488 family)